MTANRATVILSMLGLILAGVVGGCSSSGNVSKAVLVVNSVPEKGADVLVEGKPYGKTPATIRGLPVKTVLVEVEKKGFKSNWRNVTIPPAGELPPVTIDMQPKVGYVTLTSKPSGAEVVLDGKKVLGKTPLKDAAWPVGPHTYEFRLKNYQISRKTLNVEEDFRYEPDTAYLKPKEAHLEVLSEPSGAHVWLNDQLQPKITPAVFDIVPDTYTVGVHAKGYIEKDDTVTLGPNQSLTVRLVMKEGDAPAGMVYVPAGDFIMGFDKGSPDERPQRLVYVHAFYIDKYEVTNQQYKMVYPSYQYPKGKGKCPVTGVTWEQANAYAKAVGKRLPTEEEWEKAARGTDGREFPWGNTFDPNKCNSADKPTMGVQDVGRYRAGASPYGCMDMAGNAYEWTSSWYQAYPGNTEIRQDYGQLYKVLRGGSYMTGQFDCRCARRFYDRMTSSRADYGFRCAKDATPPKKKLNDTTGAPVVGSMP